ncbi:MAG TPA: carbon-nitrogen hydrolase family protein [Candidatus Latescibacteria bacterium]|nr:carbon-nitrogen hydrolase family protein [Candidatus Latescibacterota bacterium]HRS94280.1 carbon-nitrogen hydrolase family protein [Candidatus Latescibacterota bacterium]
MARLARLVSISFPGVHGEMPPVERARRAVEAVSARIDEAAYDKPDIIVLPETFTALGGDGGKDWFASAEPIPGPTTDALAAKAKQYNTHIVCPILEVRDGKRYNAAALIDRTGSIVGVYHKMHPTNPELEGGIVPGTTAPAWDTDIGRVGCAICFDLNFRDVADSLAAHRAELVCFCSMYRGGLSTQIWAFEYGFWFISATPAENSVIRNPLGQLVVQSFAYSPTIVAEANLDCVVCHIDCNQEKIPALKKKYGPLAEIHSISPEAVFLLTSRHPTVSARDMVEEFKFETRTEYWKRSHANRAVALMKARES